MSALLGCGPGLVPPLGDGTGTGVAASSGVTPTGVSAGDVVDTGVADSTGAGDSSDDGPPPLPPLPEYCESGVLVDAWVHIDGTELDERDKLEGIGVIDGDLVVSNSDATALSFLECIVEITGSLYLHNNDALVDVSGLAHVARIGGDLVIANNDALLEFDALTLVEQIEEGDNPRPPLVSVFHSLMIVGNGSLETISGLSSLYVVFGDVHVRDNPNLTSVAGLTGLIAIGREFSFVHNGSLCVSAVDGIVEGIEQPDTIPDSWSTIANNEGC